MKKWIFRRKEDGYMIVYNEKEIKGRKLAEELKKNKTFELIIEVDSADLEPKAYKSVPVIEDVLECPVDGTVCKDEADLLEHKEKVHGTKKRAKKT